MLAFTKDSAAPNFRTLLKGRTCQAQLYVKRIPISQVPYQDEKKCAQWLQELFQEKVFLMKITFSPLNVIDLGSPVRSFHPTGYLRRSGSTKNTSKSKLYRRIDSVRLFSNRRRSFVGLVRKISSS